MPDATDTTARDAYLDLVRAHEKLTAQFTELFKAHGLTQPQYNALRICQGALPEGATCQVIGERLLNRVPDVTRLVDRMVAAGLVRSARSAADGRVVLVRPTAKGSATLKALRGPVDTLHEEQFAGLSDRQLDGLRRGLRAVLAAP